MSTSEKSLRLESTDNQDPGEILHLLGDESHVVDNINLETLLKQAEENSTNDDLMQGPDQTDAQDIASDSIPSGGSNTSVSGGATFESAMTEQAAGPLVRYKRELFDRSLLSKSGEYACCETLATASDQLEKQFFLLGIARETLSNLKQHMDLQQHDFDNFIAGKSITRVRELAPSAAPYASHTIRYDINIRLAESLLSNKNSHWPLTSEQRSTIKGQLSVAKEAFNTLVEANLRLVIFVAKKFQNRGIDLADLIQEGNIGLLRAASRFDHAKGFKFSTYAYWWIRQSIQNSLGNSRSLIRYPSSYYQELIKVHACANRSFQSTGKSMDIKSIAEFAEMTPEKVSNVLALSHRIFSADMPANAESQTTFMDFFEDTSSLAIADQINVTDNLKLVNALTSHLNAREKYVIQHRFGLGLSRYYSLQEVSEMLGCTRERVRQIEKASLKKIKELANVTETISQTDDKLTN